MLLVADDVAGAIHILDVGACYIPHNEASSSSHKVHDAGLLYGLLSVVVIVFVAIFGGVLVFMIRGLRNGKRKATQRSYGAINTDDHSNNDIESTSISKYDSRTDNVNTDVYSKSRESIIEGDSE